VVVVVVVAVVVVAVVVVVVGLVVLTVVYASGGESIADKIEIVHLELVVEDIRPLVSGMGRVWLHCPERAGEGLWLGGWCSKTGLLVGVVDVRVQNRERARDGLEQTGICESAVVG